MNSEPTHPRFSVVLPCYNEGGTIPTLFDRFAEVLAGRTDLEVVFVDNGSRDDSAAVFERELAKPGHAFARLVTVQKNRGYGFGIMSGLRATRGEFIGWTHADSQYDPKIVLDGFARLVAEPDPTRTLVRGRRIGRNLFDALFTAGMSVFASGMLATRLSDINAQPKLFHRGLLGRMEQAPDDFALDLYILFLARRLGWGEVGQPVHFGARKHGEAKGGGTLRGKIKLIRRTLGYIVNLRRDLRATAR